MLENLPTSYHTQYALTYCLFILATSATDVGEPFQKTRIDIEAVLTDRLKQIEAGMVKACFLQQEERHILSRHSS